LTAPAPKDRLSPWVALPVIGSVLLAGADLGDRFWGSASDSRVTSFQVSQLTAAVKDLASKFDAMAKQSSVDALSGRVDRDEGSIGDLKTTMAGVRADVDNLMHPQVRQPR
jgi:outer membrane murein-binding lipoprotein Lpp